MRNRVIALFLIYCTFFVNNFLTILLKNDIILQKNKPIS